MLFLLLLRFYCVERNRCWEMGIEHRTSDIELALVFTNCIKLFGSLTD
jgi:hypothetical protein